MPQLRAQPFTMEHWALTLPDVDSTANGPLDADEQRQLDEAHRAIDNLNSARWMLGYSLEAVRRRRLYRGDGTRTWEQYLDQEHDGMSTSGADRLQKTWRLARAVQKELGRPLPDSHLDKLRSHAEATSDEEAARAYAALYRAHQDQSLRLTAGQVSDRVKTAAKAARGIKDPVARTQAFSAAWQAELVMPAPRTEEPDAAAPDKQSGPGDPVDAALLLLERAHRAIEDAAEDRNATAQRAAEAADRQQKAIRKIGRILAKVTVDADDIVDAEIVED
ncbi:hypothetical protein [Streptomyces xanthochromogenes]|uniref:hypothetical protein n=1 Tax=Streptomyces xanthochromogenes TaxID=67384 RepID=UPI0016743985|nr:hypothetical protein [Streptomyces xanthochromogenes]